MLFILTHLSEFSMAKKIAPLLILLVFVSNVRAQEVNSWTEDSHNKCNVINPSPVENEKVKWNGECKYGFAEGFGTAIWSVNNSVTQKWVGYFNAGKPSKLKIYYFNADDSDVQIYEGGFPTYSNGIVQLTYKSFKLTIKFENKIIIGNVKIEYSDGRLYIGSLLNGAINGHGYFRYINYDEYLGEFKNGKRNGWGIFRGSIAYHGQWLNDKFHGSGVLITPDSPQGIATIGEWKNGKLNGDNIVTVYPSGINVVGDYRNGLPTNTSLAPDNAVPMPVIPKISTPSLDLDFTPIFEK